MSVSIIASPGYHRHLQKTGECGIEMIKEKKKISSEYKNKLCDAKPY